jgi:hypothetical protein
MRRVLIAAATAVLLAALAVGTASAAPPPTTSTTTTTTPPPAGQPTRGVVQCESGVSNGPWSDWVQLGSHTRVMFNATIWSGAPNYPGLDVGLSTDGVNQLPDPHIQLGSLSIQTPVFLETAWPYMRFRCRNDFTGTPVIVWVLT